MPLVSSEMNSNFPVRNLQIALRTLAEHDSPFPLVVPDGIYGPETARAVSAAQQWFGLPETGEADYDTWMRIHTAYFDLLARRGAPEPLHIFATPDAELQSGDSDDSVYAVQLILRRLAQTFSDFVAIPVTGILDPATQREVLRFQTRTLLPETGIVDRNTWDRLARMYRTL